MAGRIVFARRSEWAFLFPAPVFGCGIFDLPTSVEKARELCGSGFLKKVGIHAHPVFPFRKGRQSFLGLLLIWSPVV
ncbi:hypothetical protein C5O10_07730 [Akkermansia muciniphila]|nr:hypothetical protein C5O10_07730 [Akkermansia muciniphila]